MNRRNFRKPLLCLLILMMALCLGGCVLKPADQLYTLPQQPDAYYNLQSEIEALVTGTVSYCAPTDGENRQPIQIQDLDGDGSNEAIVFAKDTGDKPLKIFIFDQNGDNYQLASTIEGEGTSFDSVTYAQIDGSPGQEIIIGRSVGTQIVKSMSVYTFQRSSTVELMSANYSVYTTVDLDEDGRSDLFLIRFDSNTQHGTAELYRFQDGVMVRDPEQTLSDGVVDVVRMTTGYMEENVPAVFVTGIQDSGLISTDVYAISGGSMQNIAALSDQGSELMVRNYYAYSTDIDGDGIVELPDVQTLPDLDDADNATAFRLIQWYNLHLDGSTEDKLLTYHDYSYGFYLELNEAWKDRITIRLDDSIEEGAAYVFNWWNGTNLPQEELFTLYIFSGDHRNELAQSDGRFPLADQNDVTYAASIGDSQHARLLTEDSLKASFHFIRMDWKSGEM